MRKIPGRFHCTNSRNREWGLDRLREMGALTGRTLVEGDTPESVGCGVHYHAEVAAWE